MNDSNYWWNWVNYLIGREIGLFQLNVIQPQTMNKFQWCIQLFLTGIRGFSCLQILRSSFKRTAIKISYLNCVHAKLLTILILHDVFFLCDTSTLLIVDWTLLSLYVSVSLQIVSNICSYYERNKSGISSILLFELKSISFAWIVCRISYWICYGLWYARNVLFID